MVASPGTRIYGSSGGWYEIDAIEGYIARTVNAAYGTAVWLGMCYTPGRQLQFDKSATDSFWPLTIGKSVKFEVADNTRRWSIELRAVGTEKVSLPTGQVDTWTIEAHETALTHTHSGIYRCQYAPDPGFTVKRTFTLKEGNAPFVPFNAIKIEKSDRSKVAEFRAPLPGTSFDTTIGVFQIDGAEGTNLFRKGDKPNLNTTWVGGLLTYDTSDYTLNARKQQLAKLWPLEVGKSASFDADRSSGVVWNNTLKVEKTETIDTPAGTFATFVIKRQERALNGSYNAIYTYWWSPALGFPIKREVQFISGRAAPNNYELRKVTPPPR